MLVVRTLQVREVRCRNHAVTVSTGGGCEERRCPRSARAPSRSQARLWCERNTSRLWTAMSATPTPAYYIAFCAIAVAVLKAVNEEVTEPYMVRAQSHVLWQWSLSAEEYRTSHSMSLRRRRTAREIIGPGTQKLQHPLVCTSPNTSLSIRGC